MAVFPSTPKPRLGSSGSINYLTVNSEFEGNFSQTRRLATRGRRSFTLLYNAITDAEFLSLETFFHTNIGGSFDWTNDRDSNTYTVKFANSSLPFKYSPTGKIDTKIELEEI